MVGSYLAHNSGPQPVSDHNQSPELAVLVLIISIKDTTYSYLHYIITSHTQKQTVACAYTLSGLRALALFFWWARVGLGKTSFPGDEVNAQPDRVPVNEFEMTLI